MTTQDHFDAVVVGGGPAGLAAALTLGRSCRTTLLVDDGRPRNAPAAHIHNVLGFDGVPPSELHARGREELSRYPTVTVRPGAVESIAGDDAAGFVLDGTIHARKLILATGLVDELPPLPGMAEHWGRSILHCPYCHGFETRGQRLAVFGASDHHVPLAVLVTRYSADVVLLTSGADIEGRAMLAAHGVAVHDGVVAGFEGRDGKLERVRFDDGSALDRDIVFAGPPLVQRSPLAEDLGCRMLDASGVEVDDFGRTSVAGVYAVGDMARRASLPGPMAAVGVAAASGTMAAVGVDRELLLEAMAVTA